MDVLGSVVALAIVLAFGGLGVWRVTHDEDVGRDRHWWAWRPTSYGQLAVATCGMFVVLAVAFYAMSRDWNRALLWATGFVVVAALFDWWRIRGQR